MNDKWIKLYKYVPLKYVADILDNRRLYLNDGTNFNDPFEITITNRDTNNIQHVQGLHILSLTNSYRNKLIWSYYTDSHKGVCITVKVPKQLVRPICYSAKRVYNDSDVDSIISSSRFNSKKNIIPDFSMFSLNKKIAYIKDKKWIYEKEYRIVFDNNDENKLTFDNGKWFMPVEITNIYLGVNFKKNDKKIQDEIQEACKRNNIKITQMMLSRMDYSVRVKR